MIKLFNPTDKSFDTNGLGGLSDAISCKVVEERNGEFELEMEYPINGIHYSDIKLRSIILAKPNPFDDPQPFRVYGISKPINGIVTINAQHLSYDLSGIPISPFNASGVVAATAALKTNAVVDCPFTFSTDKTDTGEYALAAPTSIRALLGSDTGSLLSVYGGEYEFDKYNVILHKSRGENRGVTIAYGKNLTDLKQEENCSNVYTGVYPFYYAEDDGLQTIDEKILNVGTYDYVKILPLDLSSEFSDGMPTSAVLKAKAQEYIDNNDIGNPTVSLSISFISLKKSKEYELIHILEEVKLCDIVNVEFPALGVSSVSQCIKTEYDVINDDYTSLELGDVQTTLADTVAQQTAAISNQMSNKEVADIVDSATALITGAKGGYVVFHSATAGSKYPEEILVMDTNDINTATNVWRWNKNGLGFSSSGYNGTYNLAMTADGKINADFIKTGSLAIGSNFYVDSSGNLTSNGGTIKGGSFEGGSINIGSNFYVNSRGNLTSNGGTIKGGTISADHVHSSKCFAENTYQFIDVSSGDIIVGISDTDIIGSANEIREIKINHDGIYFRDSACLTSEGLGYRKTDYSVPPVLEVNSDGEGVYMKSTATYNRTSAGAANLYMTANGVFRRSTASSRRWKNSIAPVEGALDPDKLYDAKVRQFKFNTDYLSNKKDECYDVPVIGFIAEELDEVYPIAVTHGADDNGNPTCEDWNVRYMVPAMLQLIQEQNERLKKLEDSNAK